MVLSVVGEAEPSAIVDESEGGRGEVTPVAEDELDELEDAVIEVAADGRGDLRGRR